MSIINLKKSDIYQNPEFHFAQGSTALENWMNLQLSEDLVQELSHIVLDYPKFSTMELVPELRHARESIFNIIAYCDAHARDKDKYNKYDDKRVLAKAGIRMGPWSKHIFNYKYKPNETNLSVRYALDMLQKPQDNINILSVDHRKYVSNYYLKEAYDETTFVRKLKEKFVDASFSNIPNQDNITPIIAHHIYSEKHLWYPKFNTFKNLKGAIEDHIKDNQLDYVMGLKHNPNKFYWISDRDGIFNTMDAHYEFHKVTPKKGNIVSVDLHFESDKARNQELLDLVGDLPDYLRYKKWQYGTNCISHTNEFTLDSPDLIEDMFDCLNQLYDHTYPLLIDKLKERYPSKAFEMNLNKIEKEAAKLLQYKKQIILQGPPGTGKTRAAERIAKSLLNVEGYTDRLRILQFHPSYTYEDFVRGISTETNGTNISYEPKDRVLVEMANKAILNPEKNYVLVIDEINRANLSSVLGELIYALEYRGKDVDSMYAIEKINKISIPTNLYIIGTMNTADRSVGHIDYAIRRRFAFVDVPPEKLTDTETIWFNTVSYEQVEKLFNRTNVSNEFDVKDVQLGHSYFIVKKSDSIDVTKRDELFNLKMEYEVKPILREYVKDGVLIGKIGSDEISAYIEQL